MSRKEVPRAGLVTAALAARITNQQGATAGHGLPLALYGDRLNLLVRTDPH